MLILSIENTAKLIIKIFFSIDNLSNKLQERLTMPLTRRKIIKQRKTLLTRVSKPRILAPGKIVCDTITTLFPFPLFIMFIRATSVSSQQTSGVQIATTIASTTTKVTATINCNNIVMFIYAPQLRSLRQMKWVAQEDTG